MDTFKVSQVAELELKVDGLNVKVVRLVGSIQVKSHCMEPLESRLDLVITTTEWRDLLPGQEFTLKLIPK